MVVEQKGDAVKYASVQDLRRSCVLRRSQCAMPPDLQELMWHESIETPMKYYAEQDAHSAFAEFYAAQKNNIYPSIQWKRQLRRSKLLP
mgnify:FL=1